eukprot:6469777-Amphidinium_carterae.2
MAAIMFMRRDIPVSNIRSLSSELPPPSSGGHCGIVVSITFTRSVPPKVTPFGFGALAWPCAVPLLSQTLRSSATRWRLASVGSPPLAVRISGFRGSLSHRPCNWPSQVCAPLL